MANLTITQPPEVAFTHNPIPLVIETEILGAGSKARVVLSLPLEVDLGSTITFNGVVFKAGASPSDDTFDNENAAEGFVNLFNTTPAVNYKYTATKATTPDGSGNYAITIIANKIGTAYNIAFSFSGITNTFIVTQGTDANRGQSKKQYGIVVDVYAGITGNFNDPTSDNITELIPVATLQKNYQESNRYEFDLGPSIRDEVETHLPPPLSQTIPVIVTQMNVAYYARVYEQYASEVSDFRSLFFQEQTQIKKAVRGALPLTEVNTADLYRDFVAGLTEPLTERLPVTKSVYIGEKEWLAWMLDISLQSTAGVGLFQYLQTYVRTIVHRVDGTSYTINRTGVSALFGGIYYQRVDLAAMGVTATDEVDYYTVQAFVGTKPITRLATYKPYETLEPPKTLCWLNNRNAYETFSFAGEIEYNLTRDEKRITQTMPLQPATTFHYNQTREVLTADQVKLYSHGLDKDTALWLRSLAQSSRVFLINGNSYQSVTIEGFDQQYDSRTTLYSVAVTITDSIPENNLS